VGGVAGAGCGHGCGLLSARAPGDSGGFIEGFN
jgi:hypothetical protein